MRININRDTCLAYGVCAQSAPELFVLDGDGDPVVVQPEVSGRNEAEADLARRACPTNSIQLS